MFLQGLLSTKVYEFINRDNIFIINNIGIDYTDI